MYWDEWPLTVESGTLSCVSAENLNDHLWAYETFFTTAERKYTVYSREAQDGLFEGKKPKYPYWDELKLTTYKLNLLGFLSSKDAKFLESKARGLCKEYDKNGNSRYKLVPAWQSKDREKARTLYLYNEVILKSLIYQLLVVIYSHKILQILLS